VEFGLGKAGKADTVVVQFPSGHDLAFLDVEANTTLVVKEVDPGDAVDLMADPGMAWEDQQVTLSTTSAASSSGDYTGYYWDVDGDGRFETRSTTPSVSVVWSDRGVKAPRLAVSRMVSGMSFCVLSPAVEVDVRNVVPTAEAGENLTIGEEEMGVLNGSGSNDTVSDRPGLEYRWVVAGEDRGWSGDPTTTVSWPDGGMHVADLYVRDDDGSVDSDRLWITVVNRAPVVLHPGDQTVNEDEQVLIETTAVDASSDMPGVRYRIEFGDGNSTGWMQDARRSHVYRQSGVWTVRVHARDGDGDAGYVEFNVTVLNVGPTCMLELDAGTLDEDEPFTVFGEGMDTLSDETNLRWRFDFGDGNGTDWRYPPIARTEHSYTRAGTYTVTLHVVDDDGAEGTEAGEVRVVNVVPRVGLVGSATSVEEDEEVQLTATATDTSSDELTLRFRWDLGDGTVLDWSDRAEVEHSYPAGATYVVEVTVRDDDGDEARAQVPVKVVNVPPVAEGTQSETSVLEGESVTFDASFSRDTASDMEDLAIEWAKGSEVKAGTVATFVFDEEGMVSVVLTVTDDDGALGKAFFTVNVRNQVPDGVPTVDRTEAGVGDIFNFVALSLTDTPNDVEGLTVTWTFGDGELEQGVSVTHRYDEPGDYTVTMTVRDDNGATKEGHLFVTVIEEEGMLSSSGAWLAIAAVIVAIVVLLIALFVLGRGETEPQVDEGTADRADGDGADLGQEEEGEERPVSDDDLEEEDPPG
jgi:PKD repeat protein